MGASQRKAQRHGSKMDAKQAASIRLAVIISLCVIGLIAVIGTIIGIVVLLTPPKPDDRIIDNVYAGGINLGGMTQEEAKNALHLATDNTYSKQDMVINLPDATLCLTPDISGAELDVDAVVQEAYEYGRTGSESEQEAVRKSAATTQRAIPLLPYLNLDKNNIRQTIYEFCESHSSVKTAPTVEPVYADNANPETDSPISIIITMGTPEYRLQKEALYNLVLDYYSLHNLTLNYADHQALLAPNHSEPSAPNAQQIFNKYCILPKDAVLDEITYEIAEEHRDGYVFDVEPLQQLIDKASYGQVLTVSITKVSPEITTEALTEFLEEAFVSTISTSITSAALGANWNTNASLACDAIHNYVIKPDEEFSFNLIVGQPTADKGYKKGPGYIDTQDAEVMGGGISQTATALYCAALKANLEITERHNHKYSPAFSVGTMSSISCMGLDAYVDGVSYDLCFRNNTEAPIRILATAENGVVSIEFLSAEEPEYFVDLETEQMYVSYPIIIHQYIDKNNVLGYKDGQILQEAILGYCIETYALKFNQETGIMESKVLISTSNYDSRDRIVAEFPPEGSYTPDQPINPDDPNIPIVIPPAE